MSQSLPLALASAALLLAVAGCDFDKVDADAALAPAAYALEVPPLGQELFRMFDAEKQQAVAFELPQQF
jgi:hypothetical protein